MQQDNAPDESAWCIHGSIHKREPKARVLLHCHPPYVTALSCLKDPTMLPIDQNTARFFNRVSYDLNFGGMADDDVTALAERVLAPYPRPVYVETNDDAAS